MRAINALLLAAVLIVVAVEGWLRFSNPALTETQLFLTFWPVHLLVLLVTACVLLTSRSIT